MILVDTSVWIDHLARRDAGLQSLLEEGGVSIHPFVVTEIALGSLSRGAEIVSALHALPQVSVASQEEVMAFLHAERLFGSDIGFVDVHLLASTRLTPDTRLWTRDKGLLRAASRLGVAAASMS